MDRESKICNGCAVREKCPPQQRADRIGSGIDQGTLSPEKANSEFSLLQQEVGRNGCPASERGRLVVPLRRRIHPGRNPFFNGGIAPTRSTPDEAYVTDTVAEYHEKLFRAKGAKARRTNR